MSLAILASTPPMSPFSPRWDIGPAEWKGCPGDNFLKLHVSATDNFTGSPIPATNLAIGSTSYGRADSSGDIYIQGADNAWYDGTVYADQTRYSNYTYAMTPASAYLQITRGTNNLAGQTNTVIVGEQIALTCQFVDPATGLPSSIAPITNFQWTVPGNPISRFTNSSTHGEAFALTNMTNSSVTFYWVEGGTTVDVECNVIVKGVAMSAKTKFIVRPAGGLLDGAIQDKVRILGSEIDFGFPPGQISSNQPPGIVFVSFGTNSFGSPSEGNWSLCQVVQSTEIKFNLQTNAIQTNTSSAIFHVTNALDRFPYGLDLIIIVTNPPPPVTIYRAFDSPRSPTTGAVKLWRDDSFRMFLMFQPTKVAASIPVPVRKVEWNFSFVVTNGVNGWGIASAYTNVTANNQPATAYPYWRTNVLPAVFQTNNFWY